MPKESSIKICSTALLDLPSSCGGIGLPTPVLLAAPSPLLRAFSVTETVEGSEDAGLSISTECTVRNDRSLATVSAVGDCSTSVADSGRPAGDRGEAASLRVSRPFAKTSIFVEVNRVIFWHASDNKLELINVKPMRAGDRERFCKHLRPVLNEGVGARKVVP